MRNRILFGIFATIIFILTAFGCYIGAKEVNRRRLKLASYYDTVVSNTQNGDEKLVYLIKSDVLVPSADKKVNIALLLLNKNEPQKAETYLVFAPNAQGNTLLAEYYLLNKTESASKYLDRVTDPTDKQELQSYSDLLTGKTAQTSSLANPKTDLGKLIKAINTQEYSALTSLPILSKLTANIGSKANTNNQTLAVARYFLSKNQPNLALFTLNTLKTKTGELPVTDSLFAEALYQQGNKDAVSYISKAIALEPENQALYVTGISYARHFSNNSQADFWAERLTELQSLQK